ncbi:hypothetical protein LQZ18_08350 [Lachnospiraceae bacterium ZAX-1]
MVGILSFVWLLTVIVFFSLIVALAVRIVKKQPKKKMVVSLAINAVLSIVLIAVIGANAPPRPEPVVANDPLPSVVESPAPASVTASTVEPPASIADEPQNKAPMVAPSTPEPIKLELSMTEEIIDGKLIVEISTNLPDETHGIMSVHCEELNFTAQEDLIIRDGKTTCGPFSNGGEPLDSGNYVLGFSTPLSRLQPDSVQEVIGDSYSNFTSEYISTDGLGANIVLEKNTSIESENISPSAEATTEPLPDAEPPVAPSRVEGSVYWYEGGTLHKSSISEWKSADYDNKLATCADFIVASRDSLNFKITDVDFVKPYAVELVAFLDSAVAGDDAEQLYRGSTISDLAVMGMFFMEWIS